MPSIIVPPAPKSNKQRRQGKKQRKFGRKHRNGKPFGMRGGCGCETCRGRR